MVVRKTPKAWTRYLSNEEEPVTLEEYMAGCLSMILGAVTEGTKAARHTEGMVGAIDQLAEGIAVRAGLPYASSGKIREALDKARHEQLPAGEQS